MVNLKRIALMVKADKAGIVYTEGMKQRKFKLSPEAVVEFEKREHETREALELKRRQAVRLYGSGVDMAVVQQVSMASRRTIQRWVDSYEAAGLDGLKAGWKGGNHRGLSEGQRTALKKQLQNQRPNEVLDRDQCTGIGRKALWCPLS